jgi:hypothetical protein
MMYIDKIRWQHLKRQASLYTRYCNVKFIDAMTMPDASFIYIRRAATMMIFHCTISYCYFNTIHTLPMIRPRHS